MNINNANSFTCVTEGIFENRLYLLDDEGNAPSSAELSSTASEASCRHNTSGDENLKRAGIISYDCFTGPVLAAIGIAIKAKVGEETFYLNRKSLANYIIKRSICATPMEMQSYHSARDLKLREMQFLSDFILNFCAKEQEAPALRGVIAACTTALKKRSEILNSYQSLNQATSTLSYKTGNDKLEEQDTSLKRMVANTNKAYQEHFSKSFDSAYMLTAEKIKTNLKSKFPALKIELSAAAMQGKREFMEDAHFYMRLPQGLLLGVFDGHGGSEVSNYAAKMWQSLFPSLLTQTQGNHYRAFNLTADKIQQAIFSHKNWFLQGTTAVVCFVEIQSRLAYCATIGDSEARIYRATSKGSMAVHPLSCLRNWQHPKEAERAAIALRNPKIASEWPKVKNPKHLRFPGPKEGLNLSRALGDQLFSRWNHSPAVIHKPKISVQLIQPDDFLIVACDGFWDYVQDFEVASLIRHRDSDQKNFAKRLVKHALDIGGSLDNITAIALKFSNSIPNVIQKLEL